MLWTRRETDYVMMKIYVLYVGITDVVGSYNRRRIFACIFVSLKPKQLFILFFYCEIPKV